MTLSYRYCTHSGKNKVKVFLVECFKVQAIPLSSSKFCLLVKHCFLPCMGRGMPSFQTLGHCLN